VTPAYTGRPAQPPDLAFGADPELARRLERERLLPTPRRHGTTAADQQDQGGTAAIAVRIAQLTAELRSTTVKGRTTRRSTVQPAVSES
jgi:hypothetical protein